MKKQKQPKRTQPAAKRRDRRRKNPALANFGPISKMTEDMLLDPAFCSFLSSALPVAFPGLGRKILGPIKPGSTLKLVEVECVCGGNCLCHTGMQIAGIPCPPDCKNSGNRFDGCHRCDCASEDQHAGVRSEKE